MKRLAFVFFFLVVLAMPANAVSFKGHQCLPQSLKSMLMMVEKKWGKVEIISSRGDRPRLSSGKNSYHESCRAVDFYVKDRYAVAMWLRSRWSGGIGIYSGNFHHLHVDLGPRVTFFKNGKGTDAVQKKKYKHRKHHRH